MSHIFFTRHGQSQANADKKLAFPDSPLTLYGKQQAEALATKLTGVGIVQIVSSPFDRAMATAEIVAEGLGIPGSEIETLPSLQERNVGVLRGHIKDQSSAYYYSDKIDSLEGVETVAQLINRMQACWAQLQKISQTSGTILAVGHACSGYYLAQIAAGRSDYGGQDVIYEIDNATCIELGATSA